MKLKLFISITLVATIQAFALAGPGDVDTTFAGTGKSRIFFNPGNDVANATVTQADGKLIVGGSARNGRMMGFLLIRLSSERRDVLRESRSSGGVMTATFGGSGDQPVANAFVR